VSVDEGCNSPAASHQRVCDKLETAAKHVQLSTNTTQAQSFGISMCIAMCYCGVAIQQWPHLKQ